MTIEKKLKIIEVAIDDWSVNVEECFSNYTDKCLANYFYKVHGLNFYQPEFIKNQFEELDKAIIRRSYYGGYLGNVVIGNGLGDDAFQRSVKLNVLLCCKEILLKSKSN